jgi:hypothetical protein
VGFPLQVKSSYKLYYCLQCCHTKATVPAGLLSDGEPYGLLFMGKEGGDSTLISIM